MKKIKNKENLRQRAYLNGLTNGIDFGVQQLVAFLLNPLMVSVLGPVLFGAWKVISQLNNYMAMTDLKVSQPLKLMLSRDRSISSNQELTKQFSIAFFTMLLFLPLYLISGTIIVWISPKVSGVGVEYHTVVRIASGFLVTAFILNQVFSIYDSILRGMNAAYKRIGARSVVIILSGGATAIILYFTDYGLAGMAMVQVLSATLTGIIFYRVVKKEFNWVKLVIVKFSEIIEFVKITGWFLIQKIAKLTDSSIDMILIGILIGPEAVTVYALTKYLTNPIHGIINQIMPAVTPGMGKLMGENKIDLLIGARRQLISFNWALLAFFGSLIILWNEQFVSLWTSSEYFAGRLDNFLIILVASQSVILQIDAFLINITLNIRRKIVYILISSITSIILSLVFVPSMGITGLLIAMLIGRIFMLIGYPRIVSEITGVKKLGLQLSCSRQALFAILFLIISYLLPIVRIHNWFELAIGAIFTALILTVLIWKVLLSSEDRSQMTENFRRIKLSKTND